MTNAQIEAFIKTCSVTDVGIHTFTVVGAYGIWMRLDRKTLAVLGCALNDTSNAYQAMIDFAVANEPKRG